MCMINSAKFMKRIVVHLRTNEVFCIHVSVCTILLWSCFHDDMLMHSTIKDEISTHLYSSNFIIAPYSEKGQIEE